MSDDPEARPFTAEELDREIADAETAFTIYFRSARNYAKFGRHSDCNRCYTDAAETAAILAELRYQRERLS